jgi:serine/threonine protein kinase
MSVQDQYPNPDCRASFNASDAEPGRTVRCAKCGQAFSLSASSITDALPSNNSHPVWASPRTIELAEGADFGRFRIVRRLGRGGMGTVYLAHDTQLRRDVALKIPRIAPDESPEVARRFTREARALARLAHPNICSVHSVGEVGGIPFLTMPYIEGRTLSDLVTQPPLPERHVAEVVRTLARALAEAHARGIIHRDLKPSNVLIGPRGDLIIIDFGLARLTDPGTSRLTQSGAIPGTPAYMAPEQVKGDFEAIGPGCDIYSLGVILYELLTGQLPFEGPAPVVLGQVMFAEPPPPSAYRPDLDPRLEAICRRAMAKKIPDRYASMAEFAGTLDEYLLDKQPTGLAAEVPVAPETPTCEAPKSEVAPWPQFLESSERIWRDGTLLIIHKDAKLPDRCVKCNAPAKGLSLRRSLSWRPAGWYLQLLIGILIPIYFIPAIIATFFNGRQSARIEIGLCVGHRTRERRAIAAVWVLTLASLGLFSCGLSAENGVVVLVGLAVLLSGLIYGIVRSQPVVPTRIDQGFVWLKRVHPAYLEGFRNWEGYREAR